MILIHILNSVKSLLFNHSVIKYFDKISKFFKQITIYNYDSIILRKIVKL